MKILYQNIVHWKIDGKNFRKKTCGQSVTSKGNHVHYQFSDSKSIWNSGDAQKSIISDLNKLFLIYKANGHMLISTYKIRIIIIYNFFFFNAIYLRTSFKYQLSWASNVIVNVSLYYPHNVLIKISIANTLIFPIGQDDIQYINFSGRTR